MADIDAREDRKRQDEVRVARAAERWRVRSRRVRLYRRLLPILILVLAGGAVAWTVGRTVLSGVERRASQSRAVALERPMFHGQDAQGRAFVIGAEGAVRDPATGFFRLNAPVLRLNLGGRRVTEITADGGSYDEAGRRVVIGPNVRIVDGQHGFDLTTPEAVVDTRTGVVTGDKGISGTGPLGSLTASSYVIADQGERISFSGTPDDKFRGTFTPAS